MADGEAVGEAGLHGCWSDWRTHPKAERRVRVPTVTDPRGVDRRLCTRLGQPDFADEREQRIVRALEAFGCLLTNTCINYQTVMAPVLGEHVAYGDTGSVNYANSVCGARSNFEGGVAALWAALTGRTPRYGMHLEAERKARSRIFAARPSGPGSSPSGAPWAAWSGANCGPTGTSPSSLASTRRPAPTP